MCKTKGDLGSIEPGPVFGETNLIAQVVKKLTTVEEVCDEIE